MDQRRRNEYEGVLDAARQQHAVQDEQCLDGLTQADFVGKKHAHARPLTGVVGDGQLMVKEADAPAKEAAHWRSEQLVAHLQGAVAQIERGGWIDLQALQAIFRRRGVELGVQVRLVQALSVAAVDEEPVHFFDGFYSKG